MVEVAREEADTRALGDLAAAPMRPLLGEHQSAWKVVADAKQDNVGVARGAQNEWMKDREAIAPLDRVIIGDRMRPQ